MKISSKISLGYTFILVLFGIVTFINYRLSQSVIDNSNFLLKSESVIRNSAQLQRGIIDMENGFRGYLLTGNENFLQPYYQNGEMIPKLYADLQSTTPDTSIQTRVLYEIITLYTNWKVNFAEKMINQKRESLRSKSAIFEYNKLYSNNMDEKVGKNITDLIRDKFRTFNTYEYTMRERRRNALNDSVTRTRNLSVVLIIFSIILSLGGVSYLTRDIGRRIKGMVDIAGQIAQGNLKVNISNDHRDELANLSSSLSSMAQKLDENFTELESKNKDLNQFAYIVSHDLKAPIMGIKTVLTWIDEDMGERLNPQVKEYHQIIRGRLSRMENMISGILDLSRIGRQQKPKERVEIKELLEEIVENIVPPPGIKVHIAPDMPTLMAERVYLQQIFTNLMGNAVKYHHTKQGNIWLSCEDLGSSYRFSVADDGPGIDPAYHKKIFEVFQTLRERDAFESTGIGLSIVKKIIEEKGGAIHVESEPGNGANFIFTWPKYVEESPEPAVKENAQIQL